jgi:hypothetical protein
MFSRRSFVKALAALPLLLTGACKNTSQEPGAAAIAHIGPVAPERLLDDLARRTFDFFWATTNPANGLVPDRWPEPPFCSIAAVGFGLTAYPVGVERGYVTRAEAAARVLTTARFFHDAPQGPQATGTAGYKGFFYRYLDMQTGTRVGPIELSTVDTAWLLCGMLFCRSYFNADNASEIEIRRLVDAIEARVEWPWMQVRAPAISHGWHPETGFIKYDWKGYNEAMPVYILALGSPTHAVGPDAWEAWTGTYERYWGTLHWGTLSGQQHLTFPHLFGHQYAHCWIDFRGIQDSFMAARKLDYFENSRRAVYAQQAYAIANPMQWKGYGENVWGFTACDGPADVVLAYRGQSRRFKTYDARGAGLEYTSDDGTIAPTATVASIAFAPEIAIPAVQEMMLRYGEHIYGAYGFLDAFNPSFDYDFPLHHGQLFPGFGWVDRDYLGIDQGPILAMLENHRSELIWSTMRGNPSIRRGLQRAGFSGGWLSGAVTAATEIQPMRKSAHR